MIQNKCALVMLKSLPDNSQDLIFGDPPYALGSTVYIDIDGKPKYKIAKDFMAKWEMPDHAYWEEFFKVAEQKLKFGGRILFFGIDRQLFLFQYYAVAAGFEIKQSLYWYFICNDEKTELLTKRGWLNYKDIKKDDVVLTMNIKSETSEWQAIEDTHLYQVEDLDMTRIINKDIDQCVTPNHRVLHQSRTNNRYDFSEWKYEESHMLLNKKTPLMKFPLSFKNLQGHELFGEKLSHLLGWVFSDGYYQKGDNSVRISQSSTNISKVKIIRDLLLSLDMEFKEYSREREYTYKGFTKKYTEFIFYFNNETSRWIREEWSDRIPTYELLNMTYDERYMLFLGMMGGDGSYKMMNVYEDIYKALESNEKFNGSFTKNIYTVQFMQSLCASLGFSTSIQPQKTNKRATLNISHKNTTGIQNSKDKIYTEKYSGDVWSITTKNSNYCIRRNGKVSFTGNSNFPKATDLSKQIDKRLGVDREVIGEIKQRANGNSVSPLNASIGETEKITILNTELGKKYEGYKYSISPLKQVLETVMVFQKRTKNKSILDDVFAFENGDETISPSIWAIDSGRVPTSESLNGGGYSDNTEEMTNEVYGNFKTKNKDDYTQPSGRYPSQMFIDKECAAKIDEQSGELTSGKVEKHHNDKRNGIEKSNCYGAYGKNESERGFGDSGGASRILHHIGYLDEELDLVFYSPKVSTFEREHGCGGIEKKEKVFNGCSETSSVDIKDVEARFTTAPTSNNHPTLKPIKLIYQIAKLLKAPFPQKVFFPFSGAGSEIIGFEQAGFDKELFSMSELNAEFCLIGETRRKAWRNMDINNLDENKKHIEKRNEEHPNQGSLF